MKQKFTVTIEEMVSENFEVYAENENDAFEKACEKYKAGEFVLEPGNLTYKQMAISKPGNETTEWIEF